MNILVGMHGQYGDQFIALPFIEYLKNLYPKARITKAINKKYQGVIPILKKCCSYIDSFYISDEYENFPSIRDKVFLEENCFDMILPMMPKHKTEGWFTQRHQTAEVFDMFDYILVKDKHQINLHCPPKSTDNSITFAPFAGAYNPDNKKKLSIENAQKIVDACIDCGHTNIVQIGGIEEPKLQRVDKKNLSYYDSFVAIRKSKLFIHTDTGLGWAASGIQHPCVGLYSNEFYGKHIGNIQPMNANGHYLEANNVNNIPIENILAKINEIIVK